MPQIQGAFIAARPKIINFTQGRRAGQTKESYQLALVPRNDPHGFPAVLTCDEETFNEVGRFSTGEKIEVKYIETALDERIAVGVQALG